MMAVTYQAAWPHLTVWFGWRDGTRRGPLRPGIGLVICWRYFIGYSMWPLHTGRGTCGYL